MFMILISTGPTFSYQLFPTGLFNNMDTYNLSHNTMTTWGKNREQKLGFPFLYIVELK